MKAFRAWFLGRLLREKFLVLALVMSGAVIWLSSASTRLTATMRGFRLAQSELATQQVWLDNQAAIEKASEEAVRNLDPAKTYDATSLVSAVISMSKNAGLAANTEPPRTQRSPQFAVHTVQVTARRAELASVLRFYQDLSSKAPYLGLKEVSVQGDRSTPGMVNVNLKIDSVELVREGAAKPTPVTPATKPAAAPAAAATAAAKPAPAPATAKPAATKEAK